MQARLQMGWITEADLAPVATEEGEPEPTETEEA
jgi:hypothetical protein